MTIHRTFRSKGFTHIPNSVLRDKSLSFQARGILSLYLSNTARMPRNNKYLESVATNGRESIANAVNELIQAGYYRRVVNKDALGRLTTTIDITDEPWCFEGDPDEEADGLEDATSEVAETASSQVAPSDGFPLPGGPLGGDPAPKRKKNQEEENQEEEPKNCSATPSYSNNSGVIPVPSQTTRTPRKRVGGTGEAPPGTPRSRGTARRTASAEESPSDGARLIGAPAGSSGSPGTRRVTGARKSKPSPDSGLGLAQEFRALAEAAGLVGNSQDLNDPGLATHLTKWMGVGNNPDTPNGIRTMMKEFFTNPDKYYGDSLWIKFVNAARKLRVAQHKAQPVDYKEAWKRRQRSLEERAAAGDQRAVNVLAEERARKSNV